MSCQHENFRAQVDVHRLLPKEGMPAAHYSADVRVNCEQCGLPFRFRCTRVGLSYDDPTVSVDGQELRVSVQPDDGTIPLPPKVKGFAVRPL